MLCKSHTLQMFEQQTIQKQDPNRLVHRKTNHRQVLLTDA